ncbi:MAG: hypothetical protein ACRCWF_08675 [Beijerinckiaceae bacterium]
MFRTSGIILATSLVMAGCAGVPFAVKPLPEQRSLLDTVAIVKKVRCEAREGIINELLALFKETGSESTQRLAVSIAAQRAIPPAQRAIKDYDPVHKGLYERLDGETRDLVLRYDDAAIGFEFNFNISENEVARGGLNFMKPFFVGGKGGIGFSGMGDFTRQNNRTFGIVESFRNLVLETRDKDCWGLERGLSVAYPITGTIGLEETVSTFLRLNEHKKLKQSANTQVFTDEIQFQTKLVLSVKPTLELTNVGLGWGATGASGEFTATRDDTHKVTVAISLADDKPAPSAPKSVSKKSSPRAERSKEKVANELTSRRDAQSLSRAIQRDLRQLQRQ